MVCVFAYSLALSFFDCIVNRRRFKHRHGIPDCSLIQHWPQGLKVVVVVAFSGDARRRPDQSTQLEGGRSWWKNVDVSRRARSRMLLWVNGSPAGHTVHPELFA